MTNLTDEGLRLTVLDILGQCTCRPDWTTRNRIDPDCRWCDNGQEFVELLKQVRDAAKKEAVEDCAKVAENFNGVYLYRGSDIATAIRQMEVK